MPGINKSKVRLSNGGTPKSDGNLIATAEESNSILNMNSTNNGGRLNPTGRLQPDVAVTERRSMRLIKG